MRFIRTALSWEILSVTRHGAPCLRDLAHRCGYRLTEMCGKLGCSERYFREVFLKDVDLSPTRWLRDERMLRARRRLEEGARPAEVAEELGFTTCRAFRREFLGTYGTLPGRWIEPRSVTRHGGPRLPGA